MGAHKTFRLKQKLARAQKSNRNMPNWVRLTTDNKMRYNMKRRNWRRTKLGF